MSDFKIVMRRAPDISEDECRRRLHQAYEILLSAARKKATAPGGKFGDLTPDAAGNTDPQGDDATGE